MEQGGSFVTLAKGNRSPVVPGCHKHGGFYLGSIGGAAAKLALDSIKKVEVLEYPELGMEAAWRIEVEDFPAFIVVDDKGNDFFKHLSPDGKRTARQTMAISFIDDRPTGRAIGTLSWPTEPGRRWTARSWRRWQHCFRRGACPPLRVPLHGKAAGRWKKRPRPGAGIARRLGEAIAESAIQPLFIGGKSMGGRMASLIADDAGVAGLVASDTPSSTRKARPIAHGPS